MLTPAWLFDAYPHPRRSSLMVWVKRGGATRRLEVPYRPDFCVRADAAPLSFAERVLEADPRVESFERARRRL
ncbi:MAG TPA: hypothetical protein VGB42_06160, partial [Candidatus Thermoplasmatota archaeon]